jgi:hypothetical protein
MENLTSIAMRLSEDEIKQLMHLRKKGEQAAIKLRRRRDELSIELKKVEERLADITGESTPGAAGRRRRPGKNAAAKPGRAPRGGAEAPAGKSVRKPARKPARAKAAKAARIESAGETRGRKLSPNGLTAAVRSILAEAGAPLNANQIIEALPGAGFKINDAQLAKKRVSVLLASQKKYFTSVARGIYTLKIRE